MSISAGVALPAAVTVPIAAGDAGWRAGIAVWAPVALLAALPWLWPSVRRRIPGAEHPPAGAPAASGPGRITVVALTAFFGLQSLGAFVVMGWLPAILADAGVPGSTAGLLLARPGAPTAPGWRPRPAG